MLALARQALAASGVGPVLGGALGVLRPRSVGVLLTGDITLAVTPEQLGALVAAPQATVDVLRNGIGSALQISPQVVTIEARRNSQRQRSVA